MHEGRRAFKRGLRYSCYGLCLANSFRSPNHARTSRGQIPKWSPSASFLRLERAVSPLTDVSPLPTCPAALGRSFRFRSLVTEKGNGRLAGIEKSRVEPHNHHPVEELAFVPAPEPTHAPAVELVAYRGWFAQTQELRFELRLFVHT